MDHNFADFSDETLCRLAVSGDPAGEEALILRYTRVVRACARPLFLAGGDSEDLIQEGMLGLLDAIRQFDPRRDVTFRTFAEVCVRHRLLSAVRTAGRDKNRPLNSSVSLESGEIQTEAAAPMDPEEVMIARETDREHLSDLQHRLSPLERKVLGLYLTGASYEEIGGALHRSAKSVDNAVQRIRRKLSGPNSGEFSAS